MANFTSTSGVIIEATPTSNVYTEATPHVRYGIFAVDDDPTVLNVIVMFAYFIVIMISIVELVIGLLMFFVNSGDVDSVQSARKPFAKYWALSGLASIVAIVLFLNYVPAGSVPWSIFGLAAIVLEGVSIYLLVRSGDRREKRWVEQRRCRGCDYAGWEGHGKFCDQCGIAGPYVMSTKDGQTGCKSCGVEEMVKKFCKQCGAASDMEGSESAIEAGEGKSLVEEVASPMEKEKLMV